MVIMITAYGMVETAVKAMKYGAYDYISKPFNLEEITFVIRKALEAGSLRTQVKQLRQEALARIDTIIGECDEMVKVKNLIVKIAKSDATTVLIQGESGTGKELVAKAVHYSSARGDKPFMAINCAALPVTLLETELMGHEKGAFTDAKTTKKGLFELADGGTVFLDEIGDMHMSMQAKLLRMLEETDLQAGRRRQGHPGGRAADLRHEPGAGQGDERRTLSQGPVLPAPGRAHQPSAAARSRARRASAGTTLYRPFQPGVPQERSADLEGGRTDHACPIPGRAM